MNFLSNRGRFFLNAIIFLSFVFSINAAKDKYLVIVKDSYKEDAKFKEFITFREATYDVKVISLSEAGSNSSAIKSKIKEVHSDGGLKYALLIGGPAGGIPYETGSYNTFHGYGLMDNDKLLDVAVGCWFVSNTTELANIINKTMHTDANIGTYPKVTTQFTSYTSRPHIEEQCNAIKKEYWDKSIYEVSWMIPAASGGSASQYISALKTQINQNKTSIIAYQAHGAEDGWVNGGSYRSNSQESDRGLSVDVSDVKALTNDQVYPIIMSFACVSGSFQKKGGFGETWLTAKGGASAFIGSSKNSSHYQKCFNGSLASAFCNPSIQTLGDLFVAGKNYLRDSTSHFQSLLTTNSSGNVTIAKDDEKMYNLFGDPGMRIKAFPSKTNTPLIVKTAPIITINSITESGIHFAVSNAGEYTVNISMLNGKSLTALAKQTYIPAGVFSLSWNDVEVSNGVYLLRISGKHGVFSHRFAFMR